MRMENKNLIGELTQGKDMAMELITHLQPSSSSSSCVFLIEKIQYSFEKALSILNWPAAASCNSYGNGSPPDEEFDHSKKQKDRVFKKRKLLPRWREEVKVCSGTGSDGPLNDGYSWRKYGQKDIHRANFPRCYYRCTHRNVQGCLATKQVQRSDNDPSIFEVTYRGRHTCTQSTISGQNEATNKNLQEKPQFQRNPEDQIWFDFGEDLKVNTEDLDDGFLSACFPENVLYDYEPMMETALIGGGDGGLSDVPLSPVTSESNYFKNYDWSSCGGGVQGVLSSEQSELTEMISGSASTSVTNSPIGVWDFSLDKVDFDPNFPFDDPEFFS